MKPNKKYVANDGYEYFMCPMTQFEITQVENVGTHLGTKAIDFASGTAGYRAPYYAPATVKCISAYPSSGQGIWQTVNKVHCPNGYFGYVTFCTVHDDSFNAHVGMQVPQGSQLGNMGTKGYATGVHLHAEFIQSAYPGWVQNGYGIWTFQGDESYIDDTFYVDDTNILTPMAGNWRTTGAAPANPNKPSNPNDYKVEEEHYAVRYKVDNVRIRKGSPNGDVVGYVNAGDEVEYFAKTTYGGHRWVRDNNNQWYAISGSEERGKDMWADLIDPSEMKVNQKPVEPSKPQEKPQEPVQPNSEFPASVKFKGVDWSEHNKSFDLNGVDFVILRANWWTTTDKKFEELSTMLEKKGIPYGVYCYDYCGDEATALEQAKYTHSLIKNKKIDLGVWFDMEDADGWKGKNGYLNQEHCTMACKVFCDYFKEHGYYTGIYASSSWFGTYIKGLDYPKWVANWGSNDGTCHGDFSDVAVMHQYTSTPLDKNVMYVDMSVMKSNPTGGKPTEKPDDKPQEPSKPNDDRDSLINNLIKALTKLIRTITKWFNRKE